MSNEPQTQVEPTETPSMTWVMVLWLVSFLIVVIFGVATYLLGWWFRRA